MMSPLVLALLTFVSMSMLGAGLAWLVANWNAPMLDRLRALTQTIGAAGSSVDVFTDDRPNSLSGGAAPSSMKGFADDPLASTCGSTWTTATGNSSLPPSSIPSVIYVIVSNKVTQSGSTVKGSIVHIVEVQVNKDFTVAAVNTMGHR